MTRRFLPCFAAFSALVCLAVVPAPASTARDYEKLETCHLLSNPSNDGDSFHVSQEGKEFIFRTYFVDTPEVENEFPDRIKEQAKYFGLTPKEALRIGKIAQQFTHEKLAGKPFTVYTRWQDAKGESRLPRYYAHIVIEDKTLAELLVANGLARVFGTPANLPDRTTAAAFKARLEVLEAKAKSQHLGAWSVKVASVPKAAGDWGTIFPTKPGASPAAATH